MPIDFKPKPQSIQFTPKVQMPDAGKMVKEGASKTWDWLNTSITGLKEPTPEEMQKGGMAAAQRKGIVMMTTPLTLAGEALGGAGAVLGGMKYLKGAKAAQQVGKLAEEGSELGRAQRILKAYEGPDALIGKTPEEVIAAGNKIDPLRYSQGEAPQGAPALHAEIPPPSFASKPRLRVMADGTIIDPGTGEVVTPHPLTGPIKLGHNPHDEALMKGLDDEIQRIKDLVPNPNETEAEKLARWGRSDPEFSPEALAENPPPKVTGPKPKNIKPKLIMSQKGPEEGRRILAGIEGERAPEVSIANDVPQVAPPNKTVNAGSLTIPEIQQRFGVDANEAQRLWKENASLPPTPRVTIPDRPFEPVGPMATKQEELPIGRGAHEAPPSNVDFQSVGRLPEDQSGFGFGNDAPPPNFSWGDWWANRPRGDKAQDILGAAKSIQTSFDISWPLRQGRKIMHTKAWRQGVREGLNALKSEENATAAMTAMRKDPLFRVAEESGVSFTDLGAVAAKREEQFQSPLAEHLPLGIGRVVRGSGRAYTVMGNKARLEYFRAITKDPTVDKAAAADLVNTLTGRSKLPGEALEKASSALNQVFYSPKALYSNVKTMNPWTYVNPSTPLAIKKEYAKSLLMMAGTTLAANQIAEALGAKVTWNPTSSDFGKIVIGKTHFDPMGGAQQPIVLTARLLSGKSTTSTGKTHNIFRPKYGESSAWDTITDFGRTKLAPIPGAIVNTVTGEDPVGNETNAGKEMLKLYTPLIGQDFLEVARSNPELAGPAAMLVGIGVGQTTYDPNKKKDGKGGMFSLPSMTSMPKMPSMSTTLSQ